MICRTCKEEKENVFFTDLGAGRIGKSSRCKACDKIYKTEWAKKNRLLINEKSCISYKKRKQENEGVFKEKQKEYRIKNKDLLKISQKKYKETRKNNTGKSYYMSLSDDKKKDLCKKAKINRDKNKYNIKLKSRLKTKQNPELAQKNRDRAKKYYFENKDKCREAGRIIYNKRRKNDSLFRLSGNIKSLIRSTIKAKGYSKKSKTHKIIGADWDIVKKHIERQFAKEMNWDNYGMYGWHIDHKIPLSSAKTEEELIILFHYTNLQPLWAIDNIKKANKILPFQTIMPI